VPESGSAEDLADSESRSSEAGRTAHTGRRIRQNSAMETLIQKGTALNSKARNISISVQIETCRKAVAVSDVATSYVFFYHVWTFKAIEVPAYDRSHLKMVQNTCMIKTYVLNERLNQWVE
jgi:hypothetical protein